MAPRSVQVAEREGFEPSREFPPYAISSRVPSATRPSLQGTAGTGVSLAEFVAGVDALCVCPGRSRTVVASSVAMSALTSPGAVASLDSGQLAEWLKAPDSKSGVPARVSGVRIPRCPPFLVLAACARKAGAQRGRGGRGASAHSPPITPHTPWLSLLRLAPRAPSARSRRGACVACAAAPGASGCRGGGWCPPPPPAEPDGVGAAAVGFLFQRMVYASKPGRLVVNTPKGASS